MTSVLLELIRHKTWATHKLFALCQSLDPAMVDTTAPGTYGTIRKTLVHMVNADRNYYRRLRGEQPWEGMDEDTTARSSSVSMQSSPVGSRSPRTPRSPTAICSTREARSSRAQSSSRNRFTMAMYIARMCYRFSARIVSRCRSLTCGNTRSRSDLRHRQQTDSRYRVDSGTSHSTCMLSQRTPADPNRSRAAGSHSQRRCTRCERSWSTPSCPSTA